MCALCNFYYWSVTSVKNFCVFLMLFVDATLCFSAFDVACCSVLLLFFCCSNFQIKNGNFGMTCVFMVVVG